MLWGAIIGDIVGSVYEFCNIKTKDFPLFDPKAYFTDDTAMTIAIAMGVHLGGGAENYAQQMRRVGNIYPNLSYGMMFKKWLEDETMMAYNSWGNGAAMRVSAVAYFPNADLEKVLFEAEQTALPTHNNPEGIKGAQATAAAIFMARHGKTKIEIQDYIESKFGYELDQSVEEIRPDYSFDTSCQGTVPQAIIAFLDSNNFEDAIRNAVSLGGDSDTLAAITGSIAEAYYGIPEWIKAKASSYLDKPLLTMVNNLETKYATVELNDGK